MKNFSLLVIILLAIGLSFSFLVKRSSQINLTEQIKSEMIDDVLARYSDKTAKELSELTHEDTPWVVAEEGKNLEYEHVFYRPEKLSVGRYESL